MIVVYSSSDAFAPMTGISILSLMQSNQDADVLRIYLIDNGISPENKKRLQTLVHTYRREIIFLPPPNLAHRLPIHLDVGRWHISTFYRLFLCSLLPEDVHRCLFLDSDTLVRHSLKELWEMDLGHQLAAAVDDCRSDAYKTELGAPASGTYTNNGVMLMDLQRWREHNVEEAFLRYITSRSGHITYVDQGVFNGVLGGSGLVKEMPPKYNALTIFFCFSYEELLRLRKPSRPISRSAFEEAVTDPAILHFQSCFMSRGRPWNQGNDHPFVQEYLHILSLSPWRDMPLTPDHQSPLKRWLSQAAKRMPRRMMIAGISLVHARIYPLIHCISGKLHRAAARGMKV